VSGLTVVRLGADHVEAAGELLARTHRRHRRAEPLLPERYEDPVEAAVLVADLLGGEDAAGAAALRGGKLVGYLIGAPRAEPVWGANRWVAPGGHAVVEPETIRDLYAALAQRWVDGGAMRHWAMVPAFDGTLADAWSRLSFGQQHAQGVCEVPAAAVPDGVRAARADDIDQLIELSYLLPRHTAASPVFSGVDPSDPDASREEVLEELGNARMGSLVAVDGERIIGGIVVVDVEESQAHTAIARPDGAAQLAWAAVRPEARGTGAGLRLTDAAFAWAHEHGYEVIVTDWRVTNLDASRFWPRRGFRTTFLRMYRSVP